MAKKISRDESLRYVRSLIVMSRTHVEEVIEDARAQLADTDRRVSDAISNVIGKVVEAEVTLQHLTQIEHIFKPECGYKGAYVDFHAYVTAMRKELLHKSASHSSWSCMFLTALNTAEREVACSLFSEHSMGLIAQIENVLEDAE